MDLNNTDDKQSNTPVTRAIYYYWAAMLSTVIRETGFDVIQKNVFKIKKKKRFVRLKAGYFFVVDPSNVCFSLSSRYYVSVINIFSIPLRP